MTEHAAEPGRIRGWFSRTLASGTWQQKLRLWSGLVMFAFCLSHFTNHALGIISVKAMDRGSLWHYEVWGSPFAVGVLATAACLHVGLALWRTAQRHTLAMPTWEFTQLVLGLYIPWTLIPHVLATLGLKNVFNIIPTYPQMLTLLWPNGAVMQSVLLLVVWSHSMIGLHFWLRIYPLYRRLLPYLATFAIVFPLLALWGWIEGARRQAQNTGYRLKVTDEHFTWIEAMTADIRAIVFGLVILSLAVVAIRLVAHRMRRKITVQYPGEVKVRALPGASLLEISRMNGIPHTAVCGGRARCSTCRVRILGSEEPLPDANSAEGAVLRRIGADETIRLACQIRPTTNLCIQPLVPVKASGPAAAGPTDAYYWGVEQPVVVMFVDLRNFTAITERHLSYDVVFLLNRYLDTVSSAIRGAGGHVDKFIGDGVMAIFGMDRPIGDAARQALMACETIGGALDELNADRGPQFTEPLRLGIGLHAGPAILGRIGAAGADSPAAPITALGDVVNTASRLEAENKQLQTTLTASQEVLDAAGIHLPDATPAEILLRGKSVPLKIYAIKELKHLTAAISIHPTPQMRSGEHGADELHT
ncbi:MAG: adenylate/guanylate cyclase domain-containing protein [Roseibium sp.]|nr:adenylate/guanylate cyclase domain-containing protein [Roseibium sp.]